MTIVARTKGGKPCLSKGLRYLWKWKWKLVTQSCPTLCNPKDCSLPSSSVHAVLQARILEWVAISFSSGSSQLRDWTQVSCIAGIFFTNQRETLYMHRKAPWGQKQGTIPGPNESCSCQKASLRDQSWLKVTCTPQGRVLRQINEVETKQDDLPEGRQRPRKLPPSKGFKLPQNLTVCPCAFLQ